MICARRPRVYSYSRALFGGDYVAALSTARGALYYSVVTMATLGYGDIFPTDDRARVFVTVHLGVAVFITLLVLARFVSYLPAPRSKEPGENGPR
jgi:hypothetical protein